MKRFIIIFIILFVVWLVRFLITCYNVALRHDKVAPDEDVNTIAQRALLTFQRYYNGPENGIIKALWWIIFWQNYLDQLYHD